MLTILDANLDPITPPYLLGSFVAESPYQKLWIYNPDPLSYKNFTIKIEQDTDDSYNSWGIAKDIHGRPAGFADYLTELYWYNLKGYSYTAVWVKFMPERSLETAELQQINLRITGEQTA